MADWGNAAEWLQFLAIAGTGTAAVIVAYKQLSALNANEKMRNSFKILESFREQTSMQGIEDSPMNASVSVGELAENKERLKSYKTARD